MNKKKLSVVMAGAMLASSVAPVLAAEVVKEDKTANELGLLMEELRTLVESKVFAADEKETSLRGKSVYAIYVNGDATELDVNSTQEDWQAVFNTLDTDDKIQVWSKGFIEKEGKYYHTEVGVADVKINDARLKEIEDFITAELAKGDTNNNMYKSLIESIKKDSITGSLVIKFKHDIGLNGGQNNTVTLSVGDDDVLVRYYYDKDGKDKMIDKDVQPGDFFGFVKKAKEDSKVKAELVKEITITPGGYDLKLEDLYDGLMLTTEGHNFFEMLKEAKAMGRKVSIVGNNYKFNGDKPWILNPTQKNGYAVADCIKLLDGKTRFTVTFEQFGKLAPETYTITGTNEANTERFVSWMLSNKESNNKELKPLARVDILAGSNRYETAVKIAKEYAGLTGPEATNANETVKNVVLVNGNALVDGLAAAPLAASKTNMVYNTSKSTWENVSAPILLTEADALPKATKAYLKELMADHLVGGKETATIHLVGGESVLNKSLERELKALGFAVERYDGDNREETSLAVAKEIGMEDAFVVGAEGEADAMSIAAVAAEETTPIIVSKKGGITEDAVYELRNSDVTVIGGKNAVSEADYNAIKAEADSTLRIAGSNRQATNAEIVKKYYKDNFLRAENIIVAKDGKTNKTELVDALAAANMASEKNAPIVLATDKLSKDQLNALILNAKNAEALYQVGHGVARDVVKTIATQLGLTNR